MYYCGSNPGGIYLSHHGVKGMHWYIRRYQPYGRADRASVKGRFLGEVKSHEKETDSLLEANREYTKSRKLKDVFYEWDTDDIIKKFAKDSVKGRTDVQTVDLIREMANNTHDIRHKVYLMSKTPNAFKAEEIHKAVQDFAYDKQSREAISSSALRAYTRASKRDNPEQYKNANLAMLANILYGDDKTSFLGRIRDKRTDRMVNRFNKAIRAYNVTPEGTYKPYLYAERKKSS